MNYLDVTILTKLNKYYSKKSNIDFIRETKTQNFNMTLFREHLTKVKLMKFKKYETVILLYTENIKDL